MDALLKVLLLSLVGEYLEIWYGLTERKREESVFVTVSLRLIFLIFGNNKDNELASYSPE